MGELSAWHLLILAAVFILLFGAKRLPDGARSLGRSLRIFKTEIKGLHDDEQAPDGQSTGTQSTGTQSTGTQPQGHLPAATQAPAVPPVPPAVGDPTVAPAVTPAVTPATAPTAGPHEPS